MAAGADDDRSDDAADDGGCDARERSPGSGRQVGKERGALADGRRRFECLLASPPPALLAARHQRLSVIAGLEPSSFVGEVLRGAVAEGVRAVCRAHIVDVWSACTSLSRCATGDLSGLPTGCLIPAATPGLMQADGKPPRPFRAQVPERGPLEAQTFAASASAAASELAVVARRFN